MPAFLSDGNWQQVGWCTFVTELEPGFHHFSCKHTLENPFQEVIYKVGITQP